MGRLRTFDPDEAIEGVMRVFWSKGYAETSYEDLVAASGASRKGLYTVFGDKEALFVAALKHYRKTFVPNLLGPLEAREITMGEIKNFLQKLGKLAATKAGEKGCFMANTATDETTRLKPVALEIEGHLRTMSETFRQAFSRAGCSPKESQRLGHYCTGILQGLFVMAHARADPAMIETYVKTAVDKLE